MASSDSVKVVPLSDITADYNWNTRSKVRTIAEGSFENIDDGDPENPGVQGIKDSFEAIGQDTPVDVRTDSKSGKLLLVTGFRRYTAATLLVKEKKTIYNLPVGYIKVRDHGTLTEVAARSLNIRENSDRVNLIGADLAFGIKKMIEADKNVTAKQMAAAFGKSYQYIQILNNIVTKVKPAVFNRWRENPARTVAISDMSAISELPEDKQEAEYDRVAAAKSESTKGPKAWIDTACKKAFAIGFIIGELEREGFLTKNKNAEFKDFIRNMVKFKVKTPEGKKVSVKTEEKIASHAIEGYLKGQEAPDTKQVDEEDDGEE